MTVPTHARFASVALSVVLSLTLLLQSSGVAAQDEPAPAPTTTPNRAPTYQSTAPAGALRLPGNPPPVGDVILEDSLTGPGVIPGTLSCPSGRNVSEFVGEGYIAKVTGPCTGDSRMAVMPIPPIPNLVVPDGEIHLEMKVVSGHERALPFMVFRGKTDPETSYELNLVPSAGFALLGKGAAGVQQLVPLATRADLRGRMSRDNWNEYAIRLDGPNIWVLLNGEPILSGSDAAFDSGWIAFGVQRLGNRDDDAESAVVFRNLRISRLAEPQ